MLEKIEGLLHKSYKAGGPNNLEEVQESLGFSNLLAMIFLIPKI